MIDIDPEKVLKSPWLWDQKTIEWARKVVEERRAPEVGLGVSA